MKKLYPVILSLLLVYFSFYYTNKVVDIIREKDPIMMKIKKEKDSYEIKTKNAKIDGDKITPGKNGKKVNINESFIKMKKFGEYNESLYVFDEVEPEIKVDDYYDKYIENGLKNDNKVSLVFHINRFDNIDRIVDTINLNEVKVTMFLDGLFIENNRKKVEELNEEGHELELLSYNDSLKKEEFVEGLHSLFYITNKTPKYCYSEYDNKNVLELCNSLDMHTIVPSINASNNSFNTIKKRLTGGSIISLSNDDKYLNTIINYIKQRGYKIVTLDELISEELEK